jgi:hypothetical protein
MQVAKVHAARPLDATGKPVRRGHGRPKGARNTFVHVYASSPDAARAAALAVISTDTEQRASLKLACVGPRTRNTPFRRSGCGFPFRPHCAKPVACCGVRPTVHIVRP